MTISILRILLFSLGMCLHLQAGAQNAVTVDALITNVIENDDMVLTAQQQQLLESLDYSLPLVDNVQFRSETNNFELDRQEYRIRVRPNSLGALKATKEVYQTRLEEQSLRAEKILLDALIFRYHFIIDYVYDLKQQQLLETKKAQLSDEKKIIASRVYQEDFDVNKLVSNENNRFKINLSLDQLYRTRKQQAAVIQILTKGNYDSVMIDTTNWVTPLFLTRLNLDASETIENSAIMLKKNKIAAMEKELALDVANTKNILRYVEAEYQGREIPFFNEVFAVGIGLNLPFFGNARQQRAIYTMQRTEEENELRALKNTLDQMERTAIADFAALLSTQQAYEAQSSSTSLNALIAETTQISVTNPMNILKLKMHRQNLLLELNQIERKLYHALIDILTLRVPLTERPLQNFLSPSAYLRN